MEAAKGGTMPLLRKTLHQSATDPASGEEEWWRLVFDTEANRLYIVHEWERTDRRDANASDRGSEQVDIGSFLAEPGQHAAHRELRSLIDKMFDSSTGD
jgi:hypothetical protein